ncbi:MAG: GNAT family N-acetyltransferase [Planctomycetes bacterium]|nr:GNAT family N-acetyltransferase [Planctomycetota bacterium]
MTLTIQAATERDLDGVMPLVRDFYKHFNLSYSEPGKRGVLLEFLKSPEAGRLLVVRQGDVCVGYALLAWSFGLEFDGPVAFVDELFIRPESRGGGVGSEVLAHIESLCAKLGMRALRLEADISNTRAAELYARSGYIGHQRHLMTKRL